MKTSKRKNEEKRMYQPKILLKIMAIFGILSGVMGIVGSLAAKSILEMTETMTGIATGVEISMLDTVLGMIVSIAILAAGTLALMGRQWKVVAGILAVYMIYTVYDIISTSMMVGFMPLTMMNFIFPLLFAWGLFTSVYENRE